MQLHLKLFITKEVPNYLVYENQLERYYFTNQGKINNIYLFHQRIISISHTTSFYIIQNITCQVTKMLN